MSNLRQTAIKLVEQMSEDELVFVVKSMEEIVAQTKDVSTDRSKAFETLKRMRRKAPEDLDYRVDHIRELGT